MEKAVLRSPMRMYEFLPDPAYRSRTTPPPPLSTHPTIESTRNRQSKQAVSEGFSLSVTLVKDTGKDVRTEEYYQGCKLVLRARGLKRFTGLFVGGVSAEGLWESFDVSYCRADPDTRRSVLSTHHYTPRLSSNIIRAFCSLLRYSTRRVHRRSTF